MSVSADCFYQPRVDADFASETDEDNLGEAMGTSPRPIIILASDHSCMYGVASLC